MFGPGGFGFWYALSNFEQGRFQRLFKKVKTPIAHFYKKIASPLLHLGEIAKNMLSGWNIGKSFLKFH